MDNIAPLLLGNRRLREETKRFAKFVIVGVVGVGINLGCLAMFTELAGLYFMVSAVLAGVITTVSNYLLNNYWSFSDRRSKNHIFGFGRFVVVTGIYHGVYYGLLAMFVEVCNLHYILSAAITIGLCVPLKYTLCYRWVWKMSTLEGDFVNGSDSCRPN